MDPGNICTTYIRAKKLLKDRTETQAPIPKQEEHKITKLE